MNEENVISPAEIRECVELCARRGVTLATAESLTAGLLASTVAEVPGASRVLRGGLIVYATDLKSTLAGVDAELLAESGAVDPEVAIALARGASERCSADLGVGLTGVAGPDSQDGHEVGDVFVGLWDSRSGKGNVFPLSHNGHTTASPQERRQQIRRAGVAKAIREVAALVRRNAGDSEIPPHVH